MRKISQFFMMTILLLGVSCKDFEKDAPAPDDDLLKALLSFGSSDGERSLAKADVDEIFFLTQRRQKKDYSVVFPETRAMMDFFYDSRKKADPFKEDFPGYQSFIKIGELCVSKKGKGRISYTIFRIPGHPNAFAMRPISLGVGCSFHLDTERVLLNQLEDDENSWIFKRILGIALLLAIITLPLWKKLKQSKTEPTSSPP